MTAFTRQNIHVSKGGGETWLQYIGNDGSQREFIARFKSGMGGYGTFLTFLIKNFTVEEYFAERAKDKSPLVILEAKGYISPNMLKAMKREGVTTMDELKAVWRKRHGYGEAA